MSGFPDLPGEAISQSVKLAKPSKGLFAFWGGSEFSSPGLTTVRYHNETFSSKAYRSLWQLDSVMPETKVLPSNFPFYPKIPWFQVSLGPWSMTKDPWEARFQSLVKEGSHRWSYDHKHRITGCTAVGAWEWPGPRNQSFYLDSAACY